VMCAWIPVLFCWISNLDVEHHCPFFWNMFKGIVGHC
jgi:hypothetical protein